MKKKYIVWVLVSIVGCIALISALPFTRLFLGTMYWSFVTGIDEANYQKHTTPLSEETISDLCTKLNLPNNDKRCKPGAVVYAPEFFSTIVKTLQPNGGKWANFDEVQAMLGKYLVKKEDPVNYPDGTTVFRCLYDLRGDRVYPIGITFYSDGRMYDIVATTG